MCTANAVTDVPRCESSGVEAWALSSDLHAHCGCSDVNMCTANAVTFHLPAVITVGPKGERCERKDLHLPRCRQGAVDRVLGTAS
jgi:hypothetical protein